jgi:hypothetical protein
VNEHPQETSASGTLPVQESGGQPFPYPRKEGAVKKSLKQIMSQTGLVVFLCSLMLLSAPNLNPDFADWLTTLITNRTGVGAETAKLLVLAGPAIVGSAGLVANVLW